MPTKFLLSVLALIAVVGQTCAHVSAEGLPMDYRQCSLTRKACNFALGD